MMMAMEKEESPNLVVKVANTKELKAYSDGLQNPKFAANAVQNLPP